MAAKQLDIMKIKQLILLKGKGWSNRKIADEIGASRNTVNEYVHYLQASEQSFEELLTLTEHDLHELFPSKEYLEKDRYTDLFNRLPELQKRLKKPGATKKTIWKEYSREAQDAYGYSQFCEYFKQYTGSLDVSGKLVHKAGEKLFIDYTGKKLHYVNRDTGEIIPAEVYVSVLPASLYTYTEAIENQKKESMVKCTNHAFFFYGGVTSALVPDNLKSAVSESSKYEPLLNKTFRDLGLHYGCAINPTRAFKPQDKALVESTIKLIYQRIFYPMSNMTFFSIDEINQVLWKLLEEFNLHRLSLTESSRYKQFIELEKAHLAPLPETEYKLQHYQRAKVQRMGYIFLSEQKNYYSVPYQYIGKHVEVQHTDESVEIYYEHNRIAFHQKSYTKGEYVTEKQHLSSTHNYYTSWNSDFFIKQGEKIGEYTASYIGQLISQHDYPEVAYKRAQGIIALKSYYDVTRIEKACSMGLTLEKYSYRLIKNILENKMDMVSEEPLLTHHITRHKNNRKPSNYQ